MAPIHRNRLRPHWRRTERLRFAIAGPHPIRDEARFRLELPEPARVRIDLFDVSGRRVPGGTDETLPSGTHEVRLDSRDLAPGIYMARLRAAGRSVAGAARSGQVSGRTPELTRCLMAHRQTRAGMEQPRMVELNGIEPSTS